MTTRGEDRDDFPPHPSLDDLPRTDEEKEAWLRSFLPRSTMPEALRLAALVERGEWEEAWRVRQELGWWDLRVQIAEKWFHHLITDNYPMEATDREMLLGEASSDAASAGPEEVLLESMPAALPTLYPFGGRDMRKVMSSREGRRERAAMNRPPSQRRRLAEAHIALIATGLTYEEAGARLCVTYEDAGALLEDEDSDHAD